MASLSRDTTDTNGTVSKLPDVNNLLDKQGDMMNAASAAGQAVATQISAIANAKRDAANKGAEQATKDGDTELAAQYKAEAASWDEGGTYRVAMHTAGGALIAGLGGGSALGGAAGAGVSAALAGKLNQLADGFETNGGKGVDEGLTAGNLAANLLAGGVGGLVGGNSGYFTAANADLYNRSSTNGAGKSGTGSQLIDSVVGWAKDTYGDVPGTLSRWGNQLTAKINDDATAKASERPSDLMAQGTANGLNAVIGAGGGKPPMANPGLMLLEGAAGQSSNVVPGMQGYVPENATFAKGDNGTRASSTDNGGTPPPNLSPEGAGRSGAFNEAKRNAGVPVSQQPVEVRPNVDRQGNVQPGYQYVYEVPSEGGRTKEVIIRDDAGGHSFGKDNPQNRGAHFNDPAGNHYDY